MKKILLIISIISSLSDIALSQNNTDSIGVPYSIEHIDSMDTQPIPLIVDEMKFAIVHQDSLITQLMHDKRTGYTRGEQLIDGFRVQIYASNNQQQAKKEATELQQRIEPLIDVPVYTLSEPPFWKVRIGNFQYREVANEYKNQFLQLFPELTGSTYIVPDKIIIIR